MCQENLTFFASDSGGLKLSKVTHDATGFCTGGEKRPTIKTLRALCIPEENNISFFCTDYLLQKTQGFCEDHMCWPSSGFSARGKKKQAFRGKTQKYVVYIFGGLYFFRQN